MFCYGGAVAVLILLVMPLWVEIPLVIIVLVNFSITLRKHVLRAGNWEIVEILWDKQGRWYIAGKDGFMNTCKLMPSTYVSTWLVILNFKGNDGRKSVILFRDALDSETFRELRVRLNLEQLEECVR